MQDAKDPFEHISYPPELPISQRKDEIVAAIQLHQTLVLTGETGSGKTTQIPKMCLDAGLGRKGKRIACTQPRRVAALSVAKRVAEELKVDFGKEVGAKIRFTDQTSRQTRVKFMTDGMLLSEIQSDPLMREYGAVIIDEAHERSLNIDFLLGHLNQLRRKRPDLKIIITSATIDTDKFSESFDKAPIISVSGRVYPVDIIYAPLDEFLEESGDFTFIEGIAESMQRIQEEFGMGDTLAFLPTEKDIREAMDLLGSRFGRRLEIVPCFGRLSNADQQRIFLPSPKRKLVLATNIAETSLTIPGIRFVIDTGLARISRYNPRGRTKRLPIAKVSQSSANQRSGRCGRVADGICIRLYSEKDYISRPVYSTPEIQRANLADVILRMLASRLGDIENFPFIDPPNPSAITAGYQLLQELGALRNPDTNPNVRFELTELGRKLSRIPVDPTVGRMLLEAERRDVTHELLVIASALSIQDPRERPMDKEAAARQAHAKFEHPHSDFLSLLNIWEALHDQFEKLSQSRLRKFCKTHFLNYLRIREWRDLYHQLERSLPSRSNAKEKPTRSAKEADSLERESARYHAIHTCLLTGLLSNVGRREETNQYRFSANRKALLFPGSSLFVRQIRDKKGKRKTAGTEKGPRKKTPEWLLCGELVETNRLYARTCAAVDPSWILEAARHVLTRHYSEPQFLVEEGRVVARESMRLHGLEIQNKKVSYLKVDAEKATEIFVREALLNEDFEAPSNWEFLEANRKLIRRIQNAQTVVSVAHWMGVEEAAVQFYRKRLENVASIHDLNRFLKKPGHDTRLLLQESDLTASEEAAVDLSLFPETVELENTALPIEYHYKQGHEQDGITLKIPYRKAQALNQAMLDWLVPGHLEAKIHALLKALPKNVRQSLLPLAETASAISKTIRPTGKDLVESLKDFLKTEYSIETYNSDWNKAAIPEHLSVRVEVQNKKGDSIASARDADSLKEKLAEHQEQLSRIQSSDTEHLWAKARKRFERDITSISDLRQALTQLSTSASEDSATHSPQAIQIGSPNGIPLHAYLALRGSASAKSKTDSDPQLRIALFASPDDAQGANAKGISDLIEFELRRELAWIRSDLKELERIGPVAVAFRPMAKLKEDAFEHIRQTIRTHNLTTLDPDSILAARDAAYAKSKGLLYVVVDQIKAVLEKRQSLIVQAEIANSFQVDIDRLLPPDFLCHTPNHILPRLPVYLETIQRRAATRSQNPERDRQRQKELDHYRSRFAQITHSDSPEASQVRWMIEEFAISLFAQHLGTAYPISSKKLDQAFAKLASSNQAGPAADSSFLQTSPKQISSAKKRNSSQQPGAPSETQSSNPHTAKPDRPTQADLDSLKNLFK